ncbi:hypothetical protein VTN77DRAFT_9680 [Rasamsonia byssochlamydoides]|uniref:uncharacterized protein n=1 Tax=Rasamsonia byssochlamydoides TaxID=89139 RepID=UPI003743F30B
MGHSRHKSNVMEIHVIIDRDPAEKDQPDSRWSNHGLLSMGLPDNNCLEEYPCYQENGRAYHGYRKGIYMLPCDEQEQDRLDIFHKLFTVAKVSDKLIYAPHPSNGRFLDLGCGTGIWAIDVANKYPNAFVAGVDLAPIQPPNHPRNCEFYAPFHFESRAFMGSHPLADGLRQCCQLAKSLSQDICSSPSRCLV